MITPYVDLEGIAIPATSSFPRPSELLVLSFASYLLLSLPLCVFYRNGTFIPSIKPWALLDDLCSRPGRFWAKMGICLPSSHRLLSEKV